MIVQMTLFSLIVYDKDYAAFLDQLKKVGVFHIIEKKADESAKQTQSKLLLTKTKEAIAFLSHYKQEESAAATGTEPSADDIVKEVLQVKDKLHSASSYLPALMEKEKELQEEYELNYVVNNTLDEADGKLKVLEGFVPKPQENIFSDFLDGKGIVYLKRRASFSDDPPVLLHNNWFSRLFEPIGSLFSLPSYKDLDLTVFFAPFFALFFGFGMNDMGYGIVLFAGATVIKFWHKPKINKSYLNLVQLLGIISFLFAFITGNFFGFSLAEIPGLSFLKNFFLKDKQIFTLAIAIGFIQILLGMVLQGINRMIKFGFRYGLPQVGWIMLILHLVNMFYFKVWPLYAHIDIYVGLALIIFFANPDAGFFKGIGTGIWELFGITGLMGDLLSYIRLFALGVSSAILALVINNIAWQVEKVKYVGPILFLIILLFGHTLNLFVASLGAFVHTMRLTFVEFYKNAGFTGGGNPYKPFISLKAT